jgi:hypothetical protein
MGRGLKQESWMSFKTGNALVLKTYRNLNIELPDPDPRRIRVIRVVFCRCFDLLQ